MGIISFHLWRVVVSSPKIGINLVPMKATLERKTISVQRLARSSSTDRQTNLDNFHFYLFMIIRNNTTNEMRFSGVKSAHQRIKLLCVEGGHCLSSAPFLLLTLHVHLLLPSLAGMVPKTVFFPKLINSQPLNYYISFL